MIGKTISHYEVIEKLGEGGMGVVYKVRDRNLGRFAALKLLNSDAIAYPDRKRRFMQEARAASSLNHPNIITIYEISSFEGMDFMAMEFIHGRALDTLIVVGGMPYLTALNYAIQIADALSQAHQAGIIHRDLKPANIMITSAGLVKVLDFGLAKLTEPTSDDSKQTATVEISASPKTETGTLVGTVGYMSPEQAEGRTLDPRSDIFSFGSVFYEMMTGLRAFRKDTRMATLAAVLREDPQPVAESRRDAAPEIDQIVVRCLRKDPARRFQSMADLKAALDDLAANLRGPIQTSGVTMSRGPTTTLSRFERVQSDPGGQALPSIAVLPLVDMSPQRDQEHLCDGIAEEILNALTKLDGLRVASRTSAFHFKGKSDDVRRIGQQLNVGMVLEGSVRKAGERLRIAAQLVDVVDGYHLWSERYDREIKDVFDIQDDIARAIVEALKTRFGLKAEARIVTRHTDNVEAYNLYLKGRYHWNQWTPESMQTAIGLFQQALRQDPAYALAHSGLADAYSVLGSFGVVPPREVFPLAREAALKAIELDDSLAEAHSSLGVMKCLYEWDWPGAEKAFQRALRLNPASASAHHCFALTCLTPQNRLDEALTEIGRATELDPLAFNITAAMASILFCRGEYDRADAQNRKALHMAPNYPMTYVYQAQVYMAKGLVDKGLALLVRARDLFAGNTGVMAVLGYGYAAHGRAVEALQILADLETKSRQGYVPPSDLATIAVGLGDKDRCFEYLDEAAEARDGGLIFLAVDRKFEPLRRDPRYAALLHRMGLTASGASVSRVVER